MSERQETHAAVVAEMRGTDNKCQLATKDGTGCFHCPFGSAASNCLFDKFANRAEAAHKREVDNLNSVIQTQRSHFDAEIYRLRREAEELRKQIGNAYPSSEASPRSGCPGNGAKLREALCEIVLLCLKVGLSIHGDVACGIIASKARAALAEPPRNCDVGTAEEQSRHFCAFCRPRTEPCDGCACLEGSRKGRCEFVWAQMPYEEGEPDGSK